MKVGYVVLYVNDPEACRRFWIEQIGMVEKRRTEAGSFPIMQVGFADQPFAFELVPLELMKDNPDNLDLGTPSIAFLCSASLDQAFRLREEGREVVVMGGEPSPSVGDIPEHLREERRDDEHHDPADELVSLAHRHVRADERAERIRRRHR